VIILSVNIRLAPGIPFSGGPPLSATARFFHAPVRHRTAMRPGTLLPGTPISHAIQDNDRFASGEARRPGEPDFHF
jgi:hypothetical protein